MVSIFVKYLNAMGLNTNILNIFLA